MVKRLVEPVTRLVRSRLVRDSGVLAVSSWTNLALSMVASFILARVLGPHNLGLTIIAITIVNTITQFMDIRTGDGLIRFMGNALARGEKREALTFFHIGLTADFLLMAATFLLVLLLYPLVTLAYENTNILRGLVAIYLFTIPFSTLEGSFQSVINVYKRFNWLAAGKIAYGLARLAALVAAAPFGITAVMWAHFAVSVFSFVLWFVPGMWLLIRNFGRLRGENYRAAWKQFIPFAFHTSLTASIKAIAVNIDILILGAVRPPNEVSFYELATSAAGLITMPTSQVSAVIYPEMNEAWAVNNLDRVRHLVKRYMKLTAIISTGVWVFLIIAANWLVRLFYGVEYLPMANLIRILGAGIVIQSLLRWVRPAAMAANKPQLITFYGIILTVMRIPVLFLLVFWLGSTGAALAMVIIALATVITYSVFIVPQLSLSGLFFQNHKAGDG